MHKQPKEILAEIGSIERLIEEIWSQVDENTPKKIRENLFETCQKLREEHRKKLMREVLYPPRPVSTKPNKKPSNQEGN